MTMAEQASLEALRSTVENGFREMRDLMENRRVEEVRVQDQLDARISETEASVKIVHAFLRTGAFLLTSGIAIAGLVLLIVL